MRDTKGSRRDLALVLRGEWKTAHEAAKELGKPTGSIFGVLKRMHSEGLLEADSDPPTRGTQYRLAESATSLSEEAATAESALGRVSAGQRVLSVAFKTRLTANEVLVSSVSAGLIAWAANLPTGWLLALVEDADSFRVEQLVVAFERAGCRCHEAPVSALVSGKDLRRNAATQLGKEFGG